LPPTLGLIALSTPIVQMLFEHGLFTAADTEGTARALMWLALGLPAHVLVKALAPAFFARGDTATPLWATVAGIAVAITAALLFGRWFSADGVAAAIALGAWSTALSLISRGATTFGFAIDAEARRRLPRIAAAALAMGVLLWLAARVAPALTADGHGLMQAAILLTLIVAGMAVYVLLLGLSGAARWDEAVAAIRQPSARDLRD
jgi:putative peptidoglycan lipid II flippase